MDTDKTQQTPPQAHQRPAWMTAEWLADVAGWTGGHYPDMAREILHLDTELARLNEHLPTVEKLTRELAETEAELAISTRRLESASQERDHHLNALVAARMEIAALKTGGAS